MSQPPEYPGNPDPQSGRHSAPGYPPPPPPGYGAPPPPPPGYGGPPPPPPGYGPPQGQPPADAPGGYSAPGYSAPPPPPPGYGPPGGPAAGYPPAPGFGGAPGGGYGANFSVGEAFSWAWNKFTQNWAALAVPLIIYGVALAAVVGIPFAIAFATADVETHTVTNDYGYGGSSYETTTTGDPTALGWFLIVLGCVAALVVAAFLQAGLTTAALDIADGRPVSIGTAFKPRNVGPVLLTALLLLVGSAVLQCTIVGPLIWAFFAMFAVVAVVDKRLSPIDGIKESLTTVRANLGPSALSWLVQYAAVLVGYIACLIGMVAAVPVAMLIQVYTYRKLTGGQVAEIAQAGPPGGFPPGPPPGQQQWS